MDNKGRNVRPQITMKRKHISNKITWIIPLALCAATGAAFAQGGGPDGPGPGGPPPPPPLPPVIRALDTDHDGIIEADEIANAPQSLKTLLKSGSTSLSIADLLGPRRGRGRRGGNQGPPPPPQSSGTQSASDDSQNGPPPQESPPPQDGPPSQDQNAQGGDQNGPPQGPPPGGPGGPGGHHRPPPVIEVLDANHDGVIDASEIANAAQALKKLDRKGTGELTIPELLGPPPGRGPQGPPPDQGGPDDQQPPAQSGSNGQEGGPPPPPQ